MSALSSCFLKIEEVSETQRIFIIGMSSIFCSFVGFVEVKTPRNSHKLMKLMTD